MTPARAAIAGIHEFPTRLAGGLSKLQIKAECARRALADAGLSWSDVDALYDAGETGPLPGVGVAEYFGVTPRVIDTTAVGGSAYQYHAAHAARDIAAGRANVALLTYGSTARSESRPVGTGSRIQAEPQPGPNMETPYDPPLIGIYALAAQRHMAQYGTTPEHLAEIAVTTRGHAVRNPDAVQGLTDLGVKHTGEITVDDVLSSRLIADPLHRLDCCLISDGGGAVVIVSSAVAASLPKPPVWILGTGEAIGYTGNQTDITTSAAVRSGKDAFGQAGVRPDDIDIAMIYDSFTITVLTVLEDLGFAKKGEGGPFAAGGRLRFDRPGAPALNTDGGGLSSNHPGMRGIFLLIEATRQLRGESTAQVPGARLAVAHGNGGWLGSRHSAGTVILGRE
ncbi:thiolase C-terminal domain-containing protein [Nocardia sp. CA-120079]|uniref:thiolase C-terminal domain-containing protein n=1 Tax=Nocardia sp. CA-120079 TaxID=3239974 RepID=UPI003D99DC37